MVEETKMESTRADRAFRASRRIMPIKLPVRQADGTITYQFVVADVREDKRASRKYNRSVQED